MMAEIEQSPASLPDADLAPALFAIDPHALGGVRVRGAAADVRIEWLAFLKSLLPPGSPWSKVPVHVTDDRLLGGIDLTATLSSGRPVMERGVLASAHQGLIVLPGAERLEAGKVAYITAALDKASLRVERDGASLIVPSRIGVVALDESAGEDEEVPIALQDRMALFVDLEQWAGESFGESDDLINKVASARSLLPMVTIEDACIEALCAASVALGINSVRAPLLAVQTARHAAAFHGRTAVTREDLEIAARLVLAHRATRLPVEPEQSDNQPDQSNEPPTHDHAPDQAMDQSERPLEDVVLEAVRAAMPDGLLNQLVMNAKAGRTRQAAGRKGEQQRGLRRGRPAGTRAGALRAGARLNILETLRAAAPWQRLRNQQMPVISEHDSGRRRLRIFAADFRVIQVKHHSESTTIFVVDGSGSSALHRMAEAKGAVELLLSDCYVRRDRVALIAFRGKGSELLLSPTRSLTRVKRALAALPGGGATPLAAGIDQAKILALAERKSGKTPAIVVLTDGKGNVARDGTKGRDRGESDALAAAQDFARSGIKSLVIDTSPQRHRQAQQLAAAMGGRYFALPHANAADLSRVVRLSTGSL